VTSRYDSASDGTSAPTPPLFLPFRQFNHSINTSALHKHLSKPPNVTVTLPSVLTASTKITPKLPPPSPSLFLLDCHAHEKGPNNVNLCCLGPKYIYIIYICLTMYSFYDEACPQTTVYRRLLFISNRNKLFYFMFIFNLSNCIGPRVLNNPQPVFTTTRARSCGHGFSRARARVVLENPRVARYNP
jgi:hypothetical protein